jgi:hypothetical protein
MFSKRLILDRPVGGGGKSGEEHLGGLLSIGGESILLRTVVNLIRPVGESRSPSLGSTELLHESKLLNSPNEYE